MKHIKNLWLILLLIIVTTGNILSQEYGKIISKSEAFNEFGRVIQSKSLNNTDLQNFSNQTEKYLGFYFEEEHLFVYGDSRKLIYSTGAIKPDEETPIKIFSKSLVSELINLGGESSTVIELRSNNIISLTNGAYTLEYGFPCPPYCG